MVSMRVGTGEVGDAADGRGGPQQEATVGGGRSVVPGDLVNGGRYPPPASTHHPLLHPRMCNLSLSAQSLAHAPLPCQSDRCNARGHDDGTCACPPNVACFVRTRMQHFQSTASIFALFLTSCFMLFYSLSRARTLRPVRIVAAAVTSFQSALSSWTLSAPARPSLVMAHP